MTHHSDLYFQSKLKRFEKNSQDSKRGLKVIFQVIFKFILKEQHKEKWVMLRI